MVDESLEDTGDHAEVPEDERLDEDDYVEEEVNEDEHNYDFSDVPDGEEVELSTANLDDTSDDVDADEDGEL